MRAFEIGQQSCLIEKLSAPYCVARPVCRGYPLPLTAGAGAEAKIGLRVLMSHRLGLWEFPRVIQDFVALIGGLLSALAG